MDALARALADLLGKATPSQPPSMDVQHLIETVRDASHDESRAARASTTKVLRQRHGMVRVLIADADDHTRSRLGESLTRAGCDVVEALDGRDALVKALSQRPTLVMTEARLPILDGYALCDVLRRDSVTRTVPILVVTAETRPSELIRARRAGANAVLSKPVTPEALLAEFSGCSRS